MTNSDLISMEQEELVKKVEESRKGLQKTIFDVAIGKEKNNSNIKKQKKDIARMLTVLNSRRRLS